EDFTRRVVRWEHDGSMTVIADNYEGKPLNSPNDIVPHPDGSVWFTDPPYGDRLNEGHPDEPGGPTNPEGKLNPRIGAPDAGVLCFTKESKLIGRIRLPEVCANLAFGGPKRDRLFMCASQSLYVIQTTTQGAAPG